MIIDRGNPKQVIKNHQLIAEADWAGLGFPTKDEIPNIQFECMVRNSASLRISVWN